MIESKEFPSQPLTSARETTRLDTVEISFELFRNLALFRAPFRAIMAWS